MRRRHCRAGRAEEQPLQQRWRLRPGARGPGARVLRENRVHLVPEVLRDDRRVLARMRNSALSEIASAALRALAAQLEAMTGGIRAIERRLMAWHGADARASG